MSTRLSRYAFCRLAVTVLIVPMSCVAGRSARSVKGQTPAAASEPCPVLSYYDPATDQCESCDSLHCDHADHWNTQHQCRTLCPEHVRSLQCGQAQYYDVHTGHCSPCLAVCLFHRVKGTTRQCRASCPAFQPQGREADTTTTAHPDLTPTPGRGGQDPQVQDKPAAEPPALVWILPTSLLLLLSTGALGLVWLALRRIRGRPQEQRKDPRTSLTSTETAGPIPEEMELFRVPQEETQPGVSSRLVPTGT